MMIPGPIKQFLMRASYATMSEADQYRQREHYQMATMGWSLRNLERLGFRPESVLDVGAYVGDWTRMARAIWPDARILMIEAQREKELVLQQLSATSNGRVAYEIALLGPSSKETMIFRQNETGSSVFVEPKTDNPITEVLLPMRTLDEVASRHGLKPGSLFKIDVQGYELEVFRGGEATLAMSGAVLIEVSILDLIDGAPLLRSVVDFLGDRGFVAYDICGLNRRPLDGALWQIDMIFVPETSKLICNKAKGRGIPCTIT